MDNFVVFDQFLDAVFVVNETTEIVYVNQVASDLCGLSLKRLVGKKKLSDLFEVADYPFPLNQSSLGYDSPGPYLETMMTSLTDKGRSAKVQMAVSPLGFDPSEKLWFFVVKDVSLEESLHGKYRSELEQKEGYISELEGARAELEKYSKNLEVLVAQRTEELSVANRTLQAIINSLGQGFLTFGKDLFCGNLFTRACEDLLKTNPSGKKIDDVLAISKDKQDEFEMWTTTLFDEPLPFEDLKSLGPDWYEGSKDKSVMLEYFPIRDEGKKISDIVVVATDKTSEVEAQKRLETEKNFVEMILKFVKGRNVFVRFLKSVPSLLRNIDQISGDFESQSGEIFRLLHTLEGEAGTFSLQDLRLASRDSQHFLEKKNVVDFKASLETLKNVYLESIAIIESYFGPVMTAEARVELTHNEIDALARMAEEKYAQPLLAEEIRAVKHLETISSAFSHYDGLIQNAAEKLGKSVLRLDIVGGEHKMVLDPYRGLWSSFVHVFRNMVDHGIEESSEREMLGKPPEGHIRVQIQIDRETLIIDVSDDGRGINPDFLRDKLSTKFPDEDFSSMSDEEVLQQILRPQFSSREEIGEFSGRGVGMDAVREEVANLGGSMRVLSELGKGSQFHFEIPLLPAQMNLKRSA